MDEGPDAKRQRMENGEYGHSVEDQYHAQQTLQAIVQPGVDGVVVTEAMAAEHQQQLLHDMHANVAALGVGEAPADADQAAAAAAAAAVAAQAALDAAQGQPGVDADAVAQAALAAQMAMQNAEQAQQAAQQAAQQQASIDAQMQVLQQQLAAAGQTLDTSQLDPTQAAALGALPVSGALTQIQGFDPASLAALQTSGLNLQALQGLAGQVLIDPSGQQLQIMGADGLQLQHGAEMYAAAAHQHAATDDLAEMQRQQIETIRKADYQALAAAKRSGHLATIQFTLDLPAELADIELTERTGIVEVPANADVAMLKRLFQYQAHNKLLPALQTLLLPETGEEMLENKEDGTPLTLANYNVGNGSAIILKITIPDELDNIPMVDEALASAAYTSTSGGARTPSRKTRWTTEQIEALIEGVEKYGLSAWRTIVMDPRLASKNNMQCKDKFRNLCLTIIQGRPERGLTLPWQLKDRVRALIEQENIKGAGAFASMGGMSGGMTE